MASEVNTVSATFQNHEAIRALLNPHLAGNTPLVQMVLAYLTRQWCQSALSYRMVTNEFTVGASLQRTLEGTYRVLAAHAGGGITSVTVVDAENVNTPPSYFEYQGHFPLRRGTQIAQDGAGEYYFCSPNANVGAADYFLYARPRGPGAWNHKLPISHNPARRDLSLLYDPLMASPIIMSEMDCYLGSERQGFGLLKSRHHLFGVLDANTLLVAGRGLSKMHLGTKPPVIENLLGKGSEAETFFKTHFLSGPSSPGINGFAIHPSRTRIFVSKAFLPHVFIYDLVERNWVETQLGNQGMYNMSANATQLCQMHTNVLCSLWDVATETEILNFQPWEHVPAHVSLQPALGINTITILNQSSVRIFDIRAPFSDKPAAAKQG